MKLRFHMAGYVDMAIVNRVECSAKKPGIHGVTRAKVWLTKV